MISFVTRRKRMRKRPWVMEMVMMAMTMMTMMVRHQRPSPWRHPQRRNRHPPKQSKKQNPSFRRFSFFSSLFFLSLFPCCWVYLFMSQACQVFSSLFPPLFFFFSSSLSDRHRRRQNKNFNSFSLPQSQKVVFWFLFLLSYDDRLKMEGDFSITPEDYRLKMEGDFSITPELCDDEFIHGRSRWRVASHHISSSRLSLFPS